MFQKIIITLILLNIINPTLGKVDPPNYDFSLDTLAIFMPGNKLAPVTKKYGNGRRTSEDAGAITTRYYVEHLRFKFPVFVQSRGGVILDFFAKLPSYFLHDVFHQSLINRIGLQNKYLKKENSAIYIWENQKGNKHIYSGSCSITCFPIYYTVHPVNTDGVKPIIEKMKKVKLKN